MAKATKKAAVKKTVAKKTTTKKAAVKKTAVKKTAVKKTAVKKVAVKKVSPILKKPKLTDKGYTKSQLMAHLAEVVTAQGFGEVNKKQAAAFVDELSKLLILYAPVGATLPGIGKLVLRKMKARDGRNPQTGESIRIPARKKLAFRVSKQAKVSAGIA